MARKRSLLFYRLPIILKYFQMGIFWMLMMAIISTSEAKSPENSSLLEQAQSLTRLGHKQLNQGQPSAAIRTWERAYHAYEKSNNQEGMAGSLINQSSALQATGSYLSACHILVRVLKLEYSICKNPQFQKISPEEIQVILKQDLQNQPLLKIRIIGLGSLGDVLRVTGNPEASSIVLQKADEMVESLNLKGTDIEQKILLSRGNTERTLYLQAKNRYELTDESKAKQKALIIAQVKAKAARNLYQQVINQQSLFALQARLNQLSFLLQLEKWAVSKTNVDFGIEKQDIQALLKQILATSEQFQALPLIDSIYARLNLAETLVDIHQSLDFKQTNGLEEINYLSTALSLSTEALSIAENLQNERAKSYALATIGNVYKTLDQLPKSIQYFETAMALAQSVQAWDIAYQWQWQLGRLYHRYGNTYKAVNAYKNAMNSLDQVRSDLLPINSELQFAFKEKVEPLYYEYMNLLSEQDDANTPLIAGIHEKLRIAELENFLQCGKLAVFSQADKQESNILPPIIHFINLGNQVEIILRKSKTEYYSHKVDLGLINKDIDALLKISQSLDLVQAQDSDYLIYAQNVYKLLFEPLKKYLPNSGTIVFILDSSFQNLPLNLLHDGHKYLLDTHSISIATTSQLWSSTSIPQKYSRILAAGMSQVGPSFSNPMVPKNLKPLPEVKTEIENIKRNAGSVLELLDPQFTSQNLSEEIDNNSFQVIHLSTHAQFSSDPEQNFFLAWDKPVNVKELKFLLKNRYSSIDLLVLSACQTAKGDRRSVLGIAGTTAQAGANSTLATLWLVDAASTAELMNEFYKGLKNGLTKAEALRAAQLALKSNPKYSNPYYWAGFVLIGN